MDPESLKSLTFTVLRVVVSIQLKTSQTMPMASMRGSSAEGRMLVEWPAIVRSAGIGAQVQALPQTPTTSPHQRLDTLQIGGDDTKMTMITTTQLHKRLLLRTTDEEAPVHVIGKLLTALATLNISSIALRPEAVSELPRPWLRDEHLIQALEQSLKETC